MVQWDRSPENRGVAITNSASCSMTSGATSGLCRRSRDRHSAGSREGQEERPTLTDDHQAACRSFRPQCDRQGGLSVTDDRQTPLASTAVTKLCHLWLTRCQAQLTSTSSRDTTGRFAPHPIPNQSHPTIQTPTPFPHLGVPTIPETPCTTPSSSRSSPTPAWPRS